MAATQNPLVATFDLFMSTSAYKPGARAWRRQRRAFLARELQARASAIIAGGNNGLQPLKEYEEFIRLRGTINDRGEFRKRRHIFSVIPTKGALYASRFADYFGEDETKLENWQKLCRDLSMDPIPETITQCRKAAQKVSINIYTFLDAIAEGQPPPPIPRFDCFEDLCEWSVENDMIFPREEAKEQGALRALLRPIYRGRARGKKSRKDHGGSSQDEDDLANGLDGVHL